MNVLYNTALRQSRAIRADLDRINEALGSGAVVTPGDVGNVSASLATFTKAIEDYQALARQELVPKKKDEASERVKRFRDELADFRARVDVVKKQREEAAHQANRADLLGRRPYATSATPENPYAGIGASSSAGGFGIGPAGSGGMHARNPSIGGTGAGAAPPLGGYSFGSGDVARENHALREQGFFQNTNSALDDYIARGQAVLSDLNSQREMMKNTQKKLYSVANTLGISGDTIRMVERRAREDKWIFWAGVIVFFLFCWLVLHFLR
ncbi:Protein transport protein bos1 [Ceratocystis fimbriata CBS 114723]|uniref:Protein transport protein BOS1 n=1 Tax=Ceratocystis fimbriata CBS 114723 TaxID=1035309 RepID=A0A2C5XLB8_9PEZI|nr:Protein transport protein bos1 [Ceratocystis fimbriata CBS 114723]